MISRISVGLLVVALLALAGLQYHWIGQISVAERQRLEASVRDSSGRFSADFSGELRGLTNALDTRVEGPPKVSDIVARYRGWDEAASYPDLVKALYLVQSTSGGPPKVSRVNVQDESLQAVDWPQNLTPLDEYFRRPGNATARPLPPIEAASAIGIQLGGGRPAAPPRGRGGRGFGPGSGFDRGSGRDNGTPGGPPQPPDRTEVWLIAELDDAVFTRQIFPALFARDFPMIGDQDYRIAVVSPSSPSQVVFTSGSAWTDADLASPDYSEDLVGTFAAVSQQFGAAFRGGGGGPRAGQRGGPPLAYMGKGLRLLVKHEAGSLETAVSNLRRRNLAISFGILLVLGLGAGVVLISGQRAQRLGQLQMEFAAGVSHELRTPLAVIQSAAHNLRSGVVKDREGIEEYAKIVQKEARRLSSMVEQVMTYAETQSDRKRYDVAAVDLNNVVDRALQNMAIPLDDAHATVENRIDPGLPPAMADEAAMIQCVQNLLSNALKYGCGKDSVQIEIESEVDRAAGCIRLNVLDHGPGVPIVDERHLFDPFHRGSNAATNTPGNGLGLHLVRKIMESQKGTIGYKRAPHGGACFTLTLPAASTSS